MKDKEGLIDVGRAIKKLRERNGMTQGDIARATGLERSYVSRLEGGKINYPRLKTVYKLAHALGVSVDEFVKIAISNDGPKSK